MSKRLQVLLDPPELKEIQKAARSKRMTVAEWVRQTLREARRRQPIGDSQHKLEIVRAAAGHAFPVGDIQQMLEEIERGSGAGAPR